MRQIVTKVTIHEIGRLIRRTKTVQLAVDQVVDCRREMVDVEKPGVLGERKVEDRKKKGRAQLRHENNKQFF